MKNKQFFEGWYFRLTNSKEESVAFIPGYTLGENAHSFIQVITSDKIIDYFKYSINDLSFTKKPFVIKIANNSFSLQGLRLNLNEKNTITGSVNFYDIKQSNFNLMGPFSLIPNLPCYHNIISMKHKTDGLLKVNGLSKTFNGVAYIETDKGHSFPKGHIWAQCNTFTNKNMSISLAISEITIKGRSLPVCYALIKADKRAYKFTTYYNAKATHVILKENKLTLLLKQFKSFLRIEIALPSDYLKNRNKLVSPVNGQMSSHVNECLNAKIHVTLLKKKRVVIDDIGNMCALEINNLDVIRP